MVVLFSKVPNNITLYTVYFITQYHLQNPQMYKLQYRVGEVEQIAAADLLVVMLFAIE